jgi:hypothetical protein
MSVDTEQKLTVLNQALSSQKTKELHDRALSCLHQLHQDYLPEKSFEDFFRDHMGHTSLFAKLLAYRFFTTDIFYQLKASLERQVENIYGPGTLLLHPIFYLRFSFHGESAPIKYRKAFLDTQPHYDRAFNLYAFSFWTALVDIDAETGGLCSFEGPEVFELFRHDQKNRYNLDLYVENAATLDPILQPACVQPPLKAGSMFTFDSNVLHGATKSQSPSKYRLSLDFRLIWTQEAAKGTDHVQQLIQLFNQSPSYCNANNLLYLGDFIGASRQLKLAAEERKNEKLEHLSDCLALLPPSPHLKTPNLQMKWQDEYVWFKAQLK